jgi:N,N-dimethylformamidase
MRVAAIDPRRLDLAAEFRARPFGRHSPELQALLDIMRRAENCQDLILVSIEPGRWVLGERQPHGKPPRLFEDQIFESREAGEWAAFRQRWQALAGRELELP